MSMVFQTVGTETCKAHELEASFIRATVRVVEQRSLDEAYGMRRSDKYEKLVGSQAPDIIHTIVKRPFVQDYPGVLVLDDTFTYSPPVLIFRHPLSTSSIYYDP